jgi:uncharacterized protein YjeT (DUF2065 family)
MRAALPLLAVLALAGCKTQPVGLSTRSAPSAADVGKIVRGHHEREAVQFKAAERINVAVTGLPIEPEVREQTTVIVEANKVASAQQIDDMAAAFMAATKGFTTQHDADQKTIADLRTEVKALKDAEAKSQVATMRWIGFGAVGIGAVLVYLSFQFMPPLRQLGFGLVAAGFAVLAVAQLWAYVSAQWWFMPLTGAGLLVVGWLIVRAILDSAKQKREWSEEDKANATARAALEAIVKQTQAIKKTDGTAAPISMLLARLGDDLDKPHKAVIEDIKTKLKFATA